ncbi:Lon protease family protein [Calditrichota bacterium]
MYKKCDVQLKDLRKEIDLSKFDFDTTKNIPILDSVIGQDRAVKAINFALAIKNQSYNVFVTGMRGTGRTTIVQDLLKKHAANQFGSNDWIYVYNFEQPDEPKALELPRKRARLFERKFTKVIANLKRDLAKAFESTEYIDKKNAIVEENQTQKRQRFISLEKNALKLNIKIKSSTSGFQTIPLINNEPLKEDAFQKLSTKQKTEIEKNLKEIQNQIKDIIRDAAKVDRKTEDELETLDQSTAKFVVSSSLDVLEEEFNDCKNILSYLHDVRNDIVNNVYSFLNTGGTKEKNKIADQNEANSGNKYKINVLSYYSRLKGAPVIYEMNPTYNNLFGRIEKKSYMGYLYTDYTMIKAGSILMANGGYLILDIEQVLRQPLVYDALKRTLKTKYLHIEDVGNLLGYATTSSLKPMPIPIDLKVILIGHKDLYNMLYNADEDFRKIFKIRADFDYEVEESQKNIYKYIQFISRVVEQEKLLHFKKEGVQALIEHAYRLVSHQNMISVQFAQIVRLIRESSYWAKQRRAKFVTAKDISRALKEDKYRRNMSEEKIQKAIKENTLVFDVKNSVVGQINGLAVYSLGDYSFGKPTRITASTYIGNRGIINIEREAKLSGKLHDKGILILTGYFASKFGEKIPLSFNASLTFEQSYGMIDGDSASCAELFVLLSSLAQVPINQGIAVTGSVNQKGDVQAIGGVNEKIEGFYDVCKMNGLNGKQGVIIPCANVKNLMLPSDIINEIKKGNFQIWAVDKIEDGIRILTGVPAGACHKDGTFTKDSIFDRVQKRIKEFSINAKKFGKDIDQSFKKNNNSKDDESED